MTDRQPASAGFWITVVLVGALVGYPLSFVPACRLACGHHAILKSLCYFYWPLVRAAKAWPSDWPVNALRRYGDFCRRVEYDDYSGLNPYDFVLIFPQIMP